jgi:hypothetical protein
MWVSTWGKQGVGNGDYCPGKGVPGTKICFCRNAEFTEVKQ